nr:GntR family transcriptional regulator [Akkermansia muciniphila]
MNTHPGETAQSRTVAKLKHRLRSGQFTNAMPGERELSKALAAGRGTIRKALGSCRKRAS